MKWSTVLLLSLGVVSALLAATLVRYIQVGGPVAQETTPVPEPGEDAIRMLVAARGLPPFQIVDITDLESRAVAPDQLPDGALTTASEAVGRILLEPLTAGEPFRREVLAEAPAVDLASAIVPGKRAVTLSLDGGAGDLIQPGSVVDVIASVDGGGQPLSMTLLQSVLVLAVGERTLVSSPEEEERPRSEATTVSLLVDVGGAESLLLVQQQGRLSLALRNPADSEVVALEPTRLRELTPRTPAPVGTPPPPSNERQIVVMKGGTTEVRTVRTGEEDE